TLLSGAVVVAYGNQSFLNAGRERTNPQYLNYFTTRLLLTLLYKGTAYVPFRIPRDLPFWMNETGFVLNGGIRIDINSWRN
ncbi:MAG: hypothetical protein MR828_00735, partial [Clostridiales bacterium]|nr:hypothetical protein [Clostridiales bacterium]